LSTGEKFADVKEFKNLLLQNEDRFAKCLTEKLTTYALGRELGFSDREAIEDILKQNATKDRGLRSLVHAIVESPVFVRP
jgi:hypothetical protein